MNETPLDRGEVFKLVGAVCGEDMHAKCVLSVTNAVLGVVHAAALSTHAIGLGLAQSVGLNPKHAIKQVDRLLSNGALDVWALFAHWHEWIGDETLADAILDRLVHNAYTFDLKGASRRKNKG